MNEVVIIIKDFINEPMKTMQLLKRADAEVYRAVLHQLLLVRW